MGCNSSLPVRTVEPLDPTTTVEQQTQVGTPAKKDPAMTADTTDNKSSTKFKGKRQYFALQKTAVTV
jgi:hypothetical protein